MKAATYNWCSSNYDVLLKVLLFDSARFEIHTPEIAEGCPLSIKEEHLSIQVKFANFFKAKAAQYYNAHAAQIIFWLFAEYCSLATSAWKNGNKDNPKFYFKNVLANLQFKYPVSMLNPFPAKQQLT